MPEIDQETQARVNAALWKYWHPVALSADVADRPIPAKLLDERLVLFRGSDGVQALEDLCIHRGTPLSLGGVTDAGTIRCAYHGWEYDGSGQCTFIPARGPGASIPGKAKVRAFRIVERFGLVWCALEDEVDAPLPQWPCDEWDDKGYRCIMLSGHHWKSSAGRAIDNFLDISHLPFVHHGALGDEKEAVVPPYALKDTEYGFYFSRVDEELDTPHSEAGERIDWEYFLYFPFTAHIKKTTASGRKTVLSLLASPTGPKETVFFFGLARNYELEPEKDQKFIDFHYEVSEQDRRIVEQQRPEEIPTDLREELHLKGPDQASMRYRRMLSSIGLPSETLP